jgi:exoribonuclease R
VRSTARLDYPAVQRSLDDGSADEVLGLLREVGRLREQREVDRGGVSLNVPEQEVVCEGTDWSLVYRAPLPVENWNAQVSLLTGMAAAKLMLDGGVGVLRTIPAADPGVVASLRRSALALGVAWPTGTPYVDVIRGLNATVPAHAALLRLATAVFRGAGYTAFDGTPPALTTHAAIAAPYTHCTAPLRRLVDRYVSECCLALCAGRRVPEWVRTALPSLPDEMAAADHRAHALDRAVVDLVEAALLQGRVGESFDGVVVEARGDRGEVQLADPAVRAECRGTLSLGASVRARLVRADLDDRTVAFDVGGP